MIYSLEEHAIEWLDGLGFDSYVTVPKNRPSRFVLVENLGGNVEDHIDHPTLAIQTWADTDTQAKGDSFAIRDYALSLNLPSGVHSMRVNSGPYKFYDEDSDMPRYQTLYDVTCQLVD